VLLCVAAGDGKAEALLGALAGGCMTHLVADEALINRVYQLHGERAGRGVDAGAGP
jgi:DNA-binding transcriptional regulator LsrR (DeoR family)